MDNISNDLSLQFKNILDDLKWKDYKLKIIHNLLKRLKEVIRDERSQDIINNILDHLEEI